MCASATVINYNHNRHALYGPLLIDNAIFSPGYAGNDPESRSYIQEEGEPSEEFKKEVQKYLKENNGAQMAFREEQVEVQGDSGKFTKINMLIITII